MAGPVALSMDVRKADGDAFQVGGRVTGRLELACGRCLDQYEIPVDSAFDLRYVPEAAAATVHQDDEREIEEDDLILAFYKDGALDVVELMREQFQLALPMKPLCSQACRGLCVECGANLNRTTCACTPKWEDPRLAALKGLLDRQKEN